MHGGEHTCSPTAHNRDAHHGGRLSPGEASR
jgi:hypothetical protein